METYIVARLIDAILEVTTMSKWLTGWCRLTYEDGWEAVLLSIYQILLQIVVCN